MEEFEEFLEIVEKVRNLLTVVEGKKDKKALEKFGFENIIVLKKPLYAIVEDVASRAKDCNVLTDLDSKGKQLYSRIAKDLRKHGVKVNDLLRNFLYKKTELRQIEGLDTYWERFK